MNNTFYVPKTLGNVVANCIRQFALTEVEFPRIVGFSFGESNLLRYGKFDLCQFSSNLSNVELQMNDYDSFPFICDVHFKDVLTVKHLRDAGIKVLGNDEDVILAVPDDSEKIVKLIINKLKTSTSASDNRSLLEDGPSLGQRLDDFTIIHSRGSNFDFEVNVSSGISGDIVDIDVKTIDSEQVLRSSLDSIIKVFSDIRQESLG